MENELSPQQEVSAGIAVLKQLKGMTVNDILNSPDAMDVLTKVGETGEKNASFAISQGDQVNSKSHNFYLGNDKRLNDTQPTGPSHPPKSEHPSR